DRRIDGEVDRLIGVIDVGWGRPIIKRIRAVVGTAELAPSLIPEQHHLPVQDVVGEPLTHWHTEALYLIEYRPVGWICGVCARIHEDAHANPSAFRPPDRRSVSIILHEPERDVDRLRLPVHKGDEPGPAILVSGIAEAILGRSGGGNGAQE